MVEAQSHRVVYVLDRGDALFVHAHAFQPQRDDGAGRDETYGIALAYDGFLAEPARQLQCDFKRMLGSSQAAHDFHQAH